MGERIKIKLLWKYFRFNKILINAVIYFAVIFILSFSFIFPSINLKEGQISKKTILSDKNAVIQTEEDIKKTEKLKEERTALVEEVFIKNDKATKETKIAVIRLFTDLRALRSSGKKFNKNMINNDLLTIMDEKTLKLVLESPHEIFQELEKSVMFITDKVMEIGVRDLNSKVVKEFLKNKAGEMGLPQNYKGAVNKIVKNVLKVNLIYDERATQELREKEKESISPIVTKIQKGQPLIYAGDRVTHEHVEMFEKLGLYGMGNNIFGIIGISSYILILFFILNRFIYLFKREYYKRDEILVLIGVLFVLTLAAAGFLNSPIVLGFIPEPLLLLPLAATVMLISILIDPIIALMCGITLSLIVGLMKNFDYELIVFLFVTSSISVFVTHKVEKRSDIVSAGFLLALFNFMAMFFIDLIKGQSILIWVLTLSLAGLVNGIISAMLVLAFLPYLENIFNIPTNMKYNEIANPNHPILRRLMLKAPGTYHHSLIVSNLAESAAENIRANMYIARAGGYFHDIGKIKKPNFFIENQLPGENPHYKISPQVSALIIMSHVKEGIGLAEKHKLPKAIKDMILEHHGTSVVSFFYNKLLKDELENGLDKNGHKQFEDEEKEIFRYEGVKPKTKESGILMFADAVEAAVKSLEKPNPLKIEHVIKRIFEDKIKEGQMDNCPLTLSDIEEIKRSFLKTLCGMFHKRIEYLDANGNETDDKFLNK